MSENIGLYMSFYWLYSSTYLVYVRMSNTPPQSDNFDSCGMCNARGSVWMDRRYAYMLKRMWNVRVGASTVMATGRIRRRYIEKKSIAAHLKRMMIQKKYVYFDEVIVWAW